MKMLILCIVGLTLALLSKWSGRFAATVYCTDATGAKWTIAQHFILAGRLFAGAVVFGLLVLASFLVPPAWALWVLTFGLALLVLLNACLGGLSGASHSLGAFLSRLRRWEEIDQLIQMKKQTRRILQRYLVMFLVLVVHGFASGKALAGGACAVAVDRTASVSENSREEALTFMKSTILDHIERKNCSSIVIVGLGSETRFARRIWLDTVKEPTFLDCRAVKPEPLAGHAALFEYARSVAVSRRNTVKTACEQSNASAHLEYEKKRARFLAAFGAALSVSSGVRQSRIAPLVQDLSRSGLYQHLVVVTDGLDNPRVSLRGVAIPDGISVLMILVEPAPGYGTTTEVLVRAGEWARIRNVKVVTSRELYQGLWKDLSEN